MLGRALIGVVRFYQVAISPWFPGSCRYVPSCSSYAIHAIEGHGPLRGSWMALRRLGRCHPWGGHGYDPVPGAGSDETTEATPSVDPEHDRSVDGADGAGRIDTVMAG